MSVEEYWMGIGLDLDQVWKDFDDGLGYIEKIGGSDLYLLRLTFSVPTNQLPLFNHEAIYKTVKGTYHDVKAECFTPDKYDSAAPIYLQSIRRGSGIFEFLGQLDPMLTWLVALGAAAHGYRALLSKDQQIDKERLMFIRENFPGASIKDELAYMKAWTTFGRRRVLHRLIDQGLSRVELSKDTVKPEIEKVEPAVINMAVVVPLEHQDENV